MVIKVHVGTPGDVQDHQGTSHGIKGQPKTRSNISGPQRKSGERDRPHCNAMAQRFGRGGFALTMLARLAPADLRNKLPGWLSWPEVASIWLPLLGPRGCNSADGRQDECRARQSIALRRASETPPARLGERYRLGSHGFSYT